MEEEKRRGSGLAFPLGIICGIVISICIFMVLFLVTRTGVVKLPVQLRSLLSGHAFGGALVDTYTEEKISLLEDSIERNFYRSDVNKADLREGLYRGMIDALGDPYSTYYDEEEFAEIMGDIEGVYEGIGAYLMLSADYDYPVVTGTIKGSPAEEAGLVEGDMLMAVDGETTRELDLTTIVSRVKGERGTKVVLTIGRGGETFSIPITRQRIESPTVETEDPVDGIGYLCITEFDDVTPGQFAEGLAELKAKGMKGLILDLRSNTGGNLDAVCDIARMIIPKGVIVYTLDREGNRVDYTCDGTHEADYPIVVLTNGYTASASEILAGAIRDHDKGTLLGTDTYGKGVVQKIYSLGDDTAVKLTVETYYTPSGFDLNGIGLTPDEVLEFDADAYREDGTDNQLERATEILKERIRG